MINRIKLCQDLIPYISENCAENGVCVTFDDDIPSDDYVIIKVDKFYNAMNVKKRPASPDCLIVRRCQDGRFGLTIVELKDISSASGFTIENIREKFETCLNDFIKVKFRHYFDIDYKNVQFIFVSNIEIHKRDLGLKLEALMNLKLRFNQKNYMVTPKMPSPTIKKCY